VANVLFTCDLSQFLVAYSHNSKVETKLGLHTFLPLSKKTKTKKRMWVYRYLNHFEYESFHTAVSSILEYAQVRGGKIRTNFSVFTLDFIVCSLSSLSLFFSWNGLLYSQTEFPTECNLYQ